MRVVDRGSEALVLSSREGWDPATLETASLQLPDGTLVEVGQEHRGARRICCARFRAALGLVTLSIVVIALQRRMAGHAVGASADSAADDAAGRIVRTGRTDERVPLDQHDDAIEGLTLLVQRDAGQDRRAGHRHARRARQRGARSQDAADAAARHRRDGAGGSARVDRYREALADCVEESDRVLVMLNTLMDISEAESGAMPLQREPVRLADVVERAIELYRDVAEAKGVTLDG